MSNQNKPERPILIGDIVLGLVSLVDQFGTVLSERGRDFRQTERGRQFDQSLSASLGDLTAKQDDGLKVLNVVLDRLLSAVNQFNSAAANGNGNGNGNGSHPTSAKNRRARSPKPRRARRPANRPAPPKT